jgi:hypothetical protein
MHKTPLSMDPIVACQSTQVSVPEPRLDAPELAFRRHRPKAVASMALLEGACMRRCLRRIPTVGMLLLLSLAPAVSAQEPDRPGEEPLQATRFASFQGRMIDLSEGWGAATVCAVWSATDIRCYATIAEMVEDERAAAAADPTLEAEADAALDELTEDEQAEEEDAAALDELTEDEQAQEEDSAFIPRRRRRRNWGLCPNGIRIDWACLYEKTAWQGRMLKFRDAGYWQNLRTWHFDDQASSWATTRGAGFKLANLGNGSGTKYMFPCHDARSRMPEGFDDEARSIYLYYDYCPDSVRPVR